MAKKKEEMIEEERQSRKEVLRARRQEEQMRQVRIGIYVVVGLLVLVAVVGLVNELFIQPNRAVATVNGEAITLRDWQDRVQYERTQRIVFLENQYEAFQQNVGFIQQIYGQVIVELQDPETLGQNTLDLMVEESAIRQAAEARGITISDADVQKSVNEAFGYYDGGLPTPLPTPTETMMPTPSLTPIPTPVLTPVVTTTAVLTPVVPITPTAVPVGPTSTPFPTSTPVSTESFQQEFGNLMGRLQEYGVDEAQYREIVRLQLYREQLQEALADGNVDTQGEQASIYALVWNDEAAATIGLERIQVEEYLPIWNLVRSTPATAESPSFPGAAATEVLWQTQDALAQTVGTAVAAAAFSLPIGEPSTVLTNTVSDGTTQYYIIQVSGREVRPLPASTVEDAKAQYLATFIEAQLSGNVVISEFWRTRVPTRPILDAKFLVQPTAVPTVPLESTPAPLPTTAAVTPTPDDGS